MNEILIPEKILNELSFLYNSKKLNDLKLRLETLLSIYPNSSLLWNIEGAVKKSLQLSTFFCVKGSFFDFLYETMLV